MTMRITVLIERGVQELGLSLPAGSCELLARYLELLGKWNRGQNLTAITEPEAMVSKHVLDSLAGLHWVRGGRILDIGTGPGLPGIPLAIAEPRRQHVLLDSRLKRVQFLLYATQTLALENASVIRTRLEKYQPEGKFDTLTARAFAAFPELVRLAMPYVAAGARLVAWQGGDPLPELADVLAGSPVCGTAHAVRIPGIRTPRHIVVVERQESRAPQEPPRTV